MAVTALVDEQESDARYRMGLVLVRIIKEAYLEKGNLDKVFEVLFSGYSSVIQALIKDSNEFKMIVRLLLELDTDINARDYNGSSVLSQYVFFLGIELGFGFYPFVYSVLHYAVEFPLFEEAVCMLVRFGAEINYKNHAGRTPLHDTVEYAPWLVPCLIECGADPLIADNEGKIPFDLYTEDDESIAKLLSARKSNQ